MKHRAVRVGQQAVAPADRFAQRALARRLVPGAAGQQVERVLHARRLGRWRDEPGLGRGQLESQRHAL
jgi:hypothetical protein